MAFEDKFCMLVLFRVESQSEKQPGGFLQWWFCHGPCQPFGADKIQENLNKFNKIWWETETLGEGQFLSILRSRVPSKISK